MHRRDNQFAIHFDVHDRVVPDEFERTLPEVFPDFAPGNFTWDDELAGWVWTTFNDYQWDVNWANPDVLCEYADIILDLANHGVEVLRLDAIAFIWKRMGTSCQNQPEVHSLTQALRALTRIACPAVVFKAEAIVGPQDLLAYLVRRLVEQGAEVRAVMTAAASLANGESGSIFAGRSSRAGRCLAPLRSFARSGRRPSPRTSRS